MEIGTAKSEFFSVIKYGEQNRVDFYFDNVIQFMARAVSKSKLQPHFSSADFIAALSRQCNWLRCLDSCIRYLCISGQRFSLFTSPTFFSLLRYRHIPVHTKHFEIQDSCSLCNVLWKCFQQFAYSKWLIKIFFRCY